MRLTTARLTLRPPTADDAPFFLALLNDPGFVRFTGDRGIRHLAGAADYVTDRLLPTYQQFGYCLLVVCRRGADATPVGICGWVRRDYLDAPDLGYGFLEAHVGQGFGTEAARAVVDHGRDELGLTRVYAITTADNTASQHLLRKLGFTPADHPVLPDPEGRLFTTPL